MKNFKEKAPSAAQSVMTKALAVSVEKSTNYPLKRIMWMRQGFYIGNEFFTVYFNSTVHNILTLDTTFSRLDARSIIGNTTSCWMQRRTESIFLLLCVCKC